jgi:hypothetical protein
MSLQGLLGIKIGFYLCSYRFSFKMGNKFWNLGGIALTFFYLGCIDPIPLSAVRLVDPVE